MDHQRVIFISKKVSLTCNRQWCVQMMKKVQPPHKEVHGVHVGICARKRNVSGIAFSRRQRN